MKKRIAFLLAIFLFLPACHRAEAANSSLEVLSTRILNAVSDKEAFVAADEDFLSDNFGSFDYIEDSNIFLDSDNATREFGIFRITDRRKATEFKQAVQEYLSNEQKALESLAALYPTQELESRLSLYQNATVGNEGMLVYYLVLNKEETRKAIEALTGR